ncbi:MAG: DUF6088 family protein [Capsulimonadales bacterium]|nr:DUF6088 family protein [Capsulimonadales bacterium]
MPKPISEKIRRRILKDGEGSIFLVRDFLDFGTRETVTRILSRLAGEGFIRRLQQGVYEYPRISKLLGKASPPEPGKVAEAVARRTGNRVVPTEAQTANALGLTTQVQARNIYLTDGGKKRRVRVQNQTIELRPTSARYFPRNGSEAIIQGLRFVGEGNITEEMIERMQGELTNRQKAALRRKLPDAPSWMLPALRRIVERKPGPE